MCGETDLSGNTLGQYDVGHNYAGGALMTSYCVPGHASVGSVCLLRLFSLFTYGTAVVFFEIWSFLQYFYEKFYLLLAYL